MKIPFLLGKNIYLRPLLEDDIGDNYLSWLNDPNVNKYSTRRYFPTSEADLHLFFGNLRNNKDLITLAIICIDNDTHVGNIQLGPIEWVNRSAKISILIGEKEYWNKGICQEAIELMTKHAFKTLNLHRLFAGTSNPAFKRIMEKLGWTLEGTLKEAEFLGGKYVDSYVFGIINKSTGDWSS